MPILVKLSVVVEDDTLIVYLIYRLHYGVKPKLITGYVNKRMAYRKMDEWNNREKKWDGNHSYYIKEFEIIE